MGKRLESDESSSDLSSFRTFLPFRQCAHISPDFLPRPCACATRYSNVRTTRFPVSLRQSAAVADRFLDERAAVGVERGFRLRAAARGVAAELEQRLQHRLRLLRIQYAQ